MPYSAKHGIDKYAINKINTIDLSRNKWHYNIHCTVQQWLLQPSNQPSSEDLRLSRRFLVRFAIPAYETHCSANHVLPRRHTSVRRKSRVWTPSGSVAACGETTVTLVEGLSDWTGRASCEHEGNLSGKTKAIADAANRSGKTQSKDVATFKQHPSLKNTQRATVALLPADDENYPKHI
jgi:hypothetical protein